MGHAELLGMLLLSLYLSWRKTWNVSCFTAKFRSNTSGPFLLIFVNVWDCQCWAFLNNWYKHVLPKVLHYHLAGLMFLETLNSFNPIYLLPSRTVSQLTSPDQSAKSSGVLTEHATRKLNNSQYLVRCHS
jgi:hypothetical protein